MYVKSLIRSPKKRDIIIKIGADTSVIQSNCISGFIRENELPRARRMMAAHPMAPPRAHKSPKIVKLLDVGSLVSIAQTTPVKARVSPASLILVMVSFGKKK